MQIYLVGGAVRDQLLGIDAKDRDWVVVGATPQAMRDRGYQQVTADFPVFLHPETGEEYALARTEQKSGSGYQGFTCDYSIQTTLEQDLKRRDLTINAMALNEQGELIDPFNGQQDLQHKRLAHITSTFAEDPLRVLRVARFGAYLQARGFEVAADTITLMQTMSRSGELATLTPERVWQETQKALTTARPDSYFRILHETNALSELFPEVDCLFGIPAYFPTLHRNNAQPGNRPNQETEHDRGDHHQPVKDAGEHALDSLTQAAALTGDVSIRLSALLLGVGRSRSNSRLWPQHDGFETLSGPIIQHFCQRFRSTKSLRELATLAAQNHQMIHRTCSLTPAEVVALLDRCDVWRRPERFQQLLTVCEAEAWAREHSDVVGNKSFAAAPVLTSGSERELQNRRSCNSSYEPSYVLQEAERKCREIDVQRLVEQGYRGQYLKDHLQAKKVEVVDSINTKPDA